MRPARLPGEDAHKLQAGPLKVMKKVYQDMKIAKEFETAFGSGRVLKLGCMPGWHQEP